VITQELGEGGADRLVTREDAQEYVDRSVHCDHPGAGRGRGGLAGHQGGSTRVCRQVSSLYFSLDPDPSVFVSPVSGSA
jgi:hypothetical protein